jgi:hypothetical protein
MKSLLESYEYLQTLISQDTRWLIGHITEHFVSPELFAELKEQCFADNPQAAQEAERAYLVASNAIKNNTISSLLASFVLLLPVSICLGTLPPQLMAKEVKGSETEKEKRIGTVYMLSTIGGLAGTFVGGYVLIPLMGVNYIVFVCGLTTLLLGIDFKKSRGYINATYVSLILGIYFVVSIFQSKNESFVYEDTLVFDSEYNRIVVSAYIDENGDEMRSMSMSAGFESATYLEEEKRNDLIFDYL